MLHVKFTNRGGGSRDTTPTVNTSALIKAGLLRKRDIKQGEVFRLKLVNKAGIVAETDFTVNRADGTTMKANRWNSHLFEMPRNGAPVSYGVCAVYKVPKVEVTSKANGAPDGHSESAQRLCRLAALNKLLSRYGTKVAAAFALGISVDTLRRMFKKAEAEAATAPAENKTATKAKSKKTANSKAPKNSRSNTYGAAKISLEELKSALKSGGTVTGAAKVLGVSRETVRRARDYFGV